MFLINCRGKKMGHILFKTVFLTFYIFFTVTTCVYAKTVTLGWDPSPSSGVVGYKIYYKAGSSELPFDGSGADEGTSPIDVGANLISTVSGLPDNLTHYFTVTAYDTTGNESVYSNSVVSPPVIVATNHAPVLDAIGNKSVNEGALLSFSLHASDPDGDSLAYSATSLPIGASFNPSTQTFAWTPGTSQTGTYSASFRVSDGALSDTETITITVSNANKAPVLATIGNKSVDQGTLLSFSLNASDPDGDSLTYSATSLPIGAAFNPSTQTFAWTPGANQAGNYSATFRVSDGDLSDTETITINVSNVNQAPVLATIGNKNVDEGKLLSFTLNGIDPDGDSLTFSAAGLPNGATFSGSTRTFNWTPGTSQAGNYSVTFRVSDGDLSDLETITISVGNVNQPPVLDVIGNKSVNQGTALEFSLISSDPDGDSLTYSATGLPDGASFSVSSGTFSWTPGIDQGGNYSVTFRVTDGNLSDSETVSINVGGSIPEGLSLVPNEQGLPGVERVDGGDDSNNYVSGLPKNDLEYVFRIILRDSSGGNLPRVILNLNGYAYEMVREAGDVKTGATYSYTTRLGPAAFHRFYFETRDVYGKTLSEFPLGSDLEGPHVELMNGKNLISVAGNINSSLLNSTEALGTSQSFRWLPSDKKNGSYSRVDNSGPVVLGEGYIIKRTSETSLPDFDPFGNDPASTHEIPVQRGWNLIANPYGGNIPLSDVLVQLGTSKTLTWEEAVRSKIMIDGVYYYSGKDWGNSDIFESNAGDQAAILVPWIGYWVYVNSLTEPAKLIVPKPPQ
jgi:hypothetical protein